MSDTRKDDFMRDLQALLNKHCAYLDIGDDGGEYGMHSGVCTITFNFKPDMDYLDFELPTHMTPESTP